MKKTELINKLADVGQRMMFNDRVPMVHVMQYVEHVSEVFDLTNDERKQLTYLIVRMK